ncbi:alpha-amylase family glycosyl hydrolase [Mucilaginibacter sp. P25]|uniref:alpha-amylase family glycosyl hydrolase n=1 Tax=Mucilaginibacter sp. P25 TaxID=3423945 RepID=UPI003D7AD234
MENFTMLQFFEWYYPAGGRLWNQLKNDAENLKKKGIDSVWLPPAYKAASGGLSAGYDVYDIYDLGEFDQKGTIATKYGTKQEYLDAIAAAQKAKLKVYVDVVLNHMGGADEIEKVNARKVDPANRNEFISEVYEIGAYTKFTFPGRKGKYSKFIWDWQCFSGIDYDAYKRKRPYSASRTNMARAGKMYLTTKTAILITLCFQTLTPVTQAYGTN